LKLKAGTWMGRKPQKSEICDLILNELSDIKQKTGVSFNELFRRIKEKRGKFSFDTLSKYLNNMEQDGLVIRIVDVNSNKKIKQTYFYKNTEVIDLQAEKINFNKILMDNNTKFFQFSNEKLKNSDLMPKFKEVILSFLEKKMGLNVNYFKNDNLVNLDTLIGNFNLFLVENPELKGSMSNFNDIVCLLYLNLLQMLTDSDLTTELHYDLFLHVEFYKLIASIILNVLTIIQMRNYPLKDLFGQSIPKIDKFSEEDILKYLLDQFPNELREKIKEFYQERKLEEFSEKYRQGLKIY
jgi:hypothetical protein